MFLSSQAYTIVLYKVSKKKFAWIQYRLWLCRHTLHQGISRKVAYTLDLKFL